MSTPSLLSQFKKSFLEFWAARNARERTILMVAALAIALALIYVLLIDPAWSGRTKLDKNLLELRQQVAHMQALSKVATALTKSSAPPLPGISAIQPLASQADIESTLARNGLKSKNVMVNGGVIKVQLASASFSGILTWLGEMQKNARLVVTDANIVALVQPDSVDATLTLRRPGNK